MSSRAGKMEKQVLKQSMPEQKTKTVQYKIDVNLAGIGIKTVYVTVSGIPEELPEEYEGTVRRAAEAQFVKTLNELKFIEFYNKDKSAKDEQPVFYNLDKLDWLKVESVTKVA